MMEIETEAKPPRATKEAVGSFCVWTKSGNRPQFFHPSLELAEAEASRLSLANNGKKYIVMQMISKFSAPTPEVAQSAADEVPA